MTNDIISAKYGKQKSIAARAPTVHHNEVKYICKHLQVSIASSAEVGFQVIASDTQVKLTDINHGQNGQSLLVFKTK